MSQLSVFAGPVEQYDEPQILSFIEFASRLRVFEFSRAETRARQLKENQSCPHCTRITVEPIELRDGQIGRNGAMIPGTGTLVGFSCNACGHEWPVKSF